ncbi:MAG: hypothetical protein M3Y32_04180 [Pseudomonadota bacterium]|nr:hypothetical protein [Pseudomonadota bacterium]
MSTTTFSPTGLHTAPGKPFQFRARMARWLGLAPVRPLTRVQEANRVRAMAARLQDREASFASDLYAAADRHELLG